MSTVINKSQITKIDVSPEKPFLEKYYIKFKKGVRNLENFINFILNKHYDEDMYGWGCDLCKVYTYEQVKNNLKIKYSEDFNSGILFEKDNQIFVCWRVNLHLSSGETYYIYFDNEDECEKYIKDFCENPKQFINLDEDDE